jgi:tRNA C32,U32 (ribose-2'-O)-methylase TrmJ
MGMVRLENIAVILVRPENLDLTRVAWLATGSSIEIVNRMEIHDDLRSALAPFEYVVGATARLGAQRPALTNPRRLAGELVSISRNNRVALLFGPEDRGSFPLFSFSCNLEDLIWMRKVCSRAKRSLWWTTSRIS